jgi:hypothetical protein
VFLLQPIKEIFNPQPSKLLQEEWKRQQDQELELPLFLKQPRNFPEGVNVHDVTLKINSGKDNHEQSQSTVNLLRVPRKKKIKTYSSIPSTIFPKSFTNSTKFDSCFKENHLKIEHHLSKRNGNCLFESVSSYLDDWNGKPFELRLKSILWTKTQISQDTPWGLKMWRKFEETKAYQDCYNMHSYMESLDFMKDPKNYGTEYDIILLCEFLKVSIKGFSPSLFFDEGGLIHCLTVIFWA